MNVQDFKRCLLLAVLMTIFGILVAENVPVSAPPRNERLLTVQCENGEVFQYYGTSKNALYEAEICQLYAYK